MKYIKLFESSFISEKDLQFKTDIEEKYIDFYTRESQYDDYENISASIYWQLRFEWLGDAGVDYYIDVREVEIKYTAIKWDENNKDTKEPKTLIFNETENFIVEKETNNQQIIVNRIEIGKNNKVTVYF